jgi:hypothetical protein
LEEPEGVKRVSIFDFGFSRGDGESYCEFEGKDKLADKVGDKVSTKV